MESLNAVSRDLQRTYLKMDQTRSLFDIFIGCYPAVKSRLGKEAKILMHPDFEAAIFTIQKKYASGRREVKADSVSALLRTITGDMPCSKRGLAIVEQASTPLRPNEPGSGSQYVDFRFLLPVSITCEFLFSKGGHALSDFRGRLLQSRFECQISLHVNANFWAIDDVNEITE